MKKSQVANIKSFCENTIQIDDWREVVENIASGDTDFEVNDHRFIHTDDIDQIQQDELSGDLYALGCSNAGFLSYILEIDCDVIASMQQSGAYEAVGKLIISMGALEEIQSEYVSMDGYGNHFNHYDGNEHELDTPDGMYHVFRIN